MAKKHRKSPSVLKKIHQRNKLPLFLNIVFHIYFAAVIIWLAFSILAVAGLMPIKDLLFSSIGLNALMGNEIVLVIICAIYFIVAIGLLQLRSWARTLAITFAIIETLCSVFILTKTLTPIGTFMGIFALIVHGFIVVYLLFSKSVLRIFKIAN
ncbi:MAG: hypothetical protein NTX24_03870 [Candidatus Pacearchaeota archaeon]|nr:hypothetical protein [Candidatus Pacearchaeota archaeon]